MDSPAQLVRRLANGLLDLEVTPKHLVAISQKNVEWKLLRLPAELRKKVYGYALGSNEIQIWQLYSNWIFEGRYYGSLLSQRVVLPAHIRRHDLRLPPEIRNTIFKYAFSDVDFHVRTFITNGRKFVGIGHRGRMAKASSTMRLPQVCRHFYNENATVFYHASTFWASENGLKVLHKALNVAQRASLSNIVLNITCIRDLDRDKISVDTAIGC